MSLNELVGQKFGKYQLKQILGEGGFGVTFKAIDEIHGDVAIKIIKSANDPEWKKEAEKAARLRDIPQIATVFDIGQEKFEINGQETLLNFIVWEYVEGITLASILEKNNSISTTLISDLAEELCLAIKGMQEIGVEHGDLHANNIILIPPKNWSPDQKYRLKIVDFGLAKSFRGDKYILDMDYLASHLKSCWDLNQKYAGELLVPDKKFQEMLTDLVGRLTDQNIERRLNDPIDAINRIYQMEEESSEDSFFKKIKLERPFEYLSVEEMPENSDLIQNLYTDNVPWLQEIEGYGTTVISGPRGSGKSMILKNMRLLTKVRSMNLTNSTIDKVDYLGFYVHCQHNLYFPFAGLGVEFDEETCNKFIHYLNLLFTAEILESLVILEKLNILNFSNNSKNTLSEFLHERIFQNENNLFLSSRNLFSQCKSLIEKEILLSQKKIQKKELIPKQTSVSYIQNLLQILDNMSDFFKNKPVYLLLDDYSHPKVEYNLQKSINRIIGFRNNRFCFKITSEKFGFIQEDQDGKTLQQDREFSYVDLGARYIKASKPEKKQFIGNIIEKRLTRSGYDLSVEEFFGRKTFKGKIANQLIKERKKGTSEHKSRFEYAGFKMIFRLCMGDVSTILQLCKEIYLEAKNQNKDLSNGISSKIQDEVIRRFSHRRLEMIKEIPSYGMELYNLVNSFGNISKSYLHEYEKAEKISSFLEVLRIELTENTDCLCDHSENLYKQLITNHIFLDGGGTYPWGRGIPNLKLILRPIFTPALKISYSDRYTVRIGCKSFEKYLIKPNEFEQNGTSFLRKLAHGQETLVPEEFSIEEIVSETMDDEDD